ncbi:Aldo/keto reductase [Ramaria rubella]|nr:Aldo/keto reductase [Ramaria rubella]
MPPLTIFSTTKLLSGYKMPLLGLGVYQNPDCAPSCLTALKHGYRHIDTAQMYKNEEGVGKALKESGLERSDVYITTKVGDGGDQTAQSIQQSLEKLDSDYIDLYLIHSGYGGKEHRLKTWNTIVDFKARGKLRDIGVSNYGVKHLEEIREAGLETPAVNQIELHPFCQQKPIVEYCKEHGITVQAYCPLIRGAFDNPVLQEVSAKVQRNPAQVLIRWSLQRGFTVLAKSSQSDRIISNASVYDFELSEEDMGKLNALDRGKAGAIAWNPIDVE